MIVWVDAARRSGQTFIISHLSATFRAVWRKRAWSFSFRLCSACVMRALERSRHWRQLAICCANLRSFITCKCRSTGQKVNPSAGFSSVCSFVLLSWSCKYKIGWPMPNAAYLASFLRTATWKQTPWLNGNLGQNALDADQKNSLPEKSCESMWN